MSSSNITQPRRSPQFQDAMSSSRQIATSSSSATDSSQSQTSTSQTSSSLGSDGQSLLCSESMLSSTPPSDELQRKSDRDVKTWKHSEDSPRYHSSQSPECRPVASTDPERIREFPLLAEKQSNSRNTPVRELGRKENETASGVSHCVAAGVKQTMTDEKYSTVPTGTTTAENLTWLADASGAPGQSEHRPLVGMQSGTTLTQQTASGTFFRPPLTEFTAAQRHFTPSQFSTVYSTSSLGQVPFPPLQYSSHIPPVTLHSSTLPTYSPYIGSPYPAAYVQPGFAHAIASGQYPQIESYSAMLASMGSHVQQSHGQGQVHRSSFIPAHLAAQISSHYLTSVGSPLGIENPDKATPPGAVAYTAVQAIPHGQHVLATQTASVSPQRRSPTPPQGHASRIEIKRERSDSRQALSEENHPSIHCKSEGSVYAAVNRSPRQSPQTVNLGRVSRVRERDMSSSPKPATVSHSEERSLRPNRPPNININPNKYEMQNQSHPRPSDVHPMSPQGTPTGPHTPSWSTAVNPMPPPPIQPAQPSPHSPHPTQTPPHTPNTPMNSTPASSTQYQLSPPAFSSQPPHPHFPPHFMKGSIIQLANGELKKVEDLRTEDFVQSAAVSEDLKIDSSTVVRIDEDHQAGLAILGFSVGEHRIQVTVESTVEHPFFVFGQGWSSVRPDRTLQRYGLSCHQLSVGDVCISLTLKDKNGRLHQKEVKPDIVQSEMAEEIEEPEFKRPKLEPPFLPHDSFASSKTGQRRSGVDVVTQQTIGLCSRGSALQENEKHHEYEAQRGTFQENTNGNRDDNDNAGKESVLHSQKKPSRLRKRRWSDPIQLVEKEKEADHLPVPLPLESLAKLSQRPTLHGISGK